MQQTHNITTLVLFLEMGKLTATISYRGYHIFSKISLNNLYFRYDCYEQSAHFKRPYFIIIYIHVHLHTKTYKHNHSHSSPLPFLECRTLHTKNGGVTTIRKTLPKIRAHAETLASTLSFNYLSDKIVQCYILLAKPVK
jgi:hypothetical protein